MTCLKSNANQLIAIEACRRDPVTFINDWVWTYDPRIEDGPKTIPFVLWDKQAEYLRWLHDRYTNRESGVVVKPRDVGATYLNCAYAVWLMVFHNQVSLGFSSRKQDLVDRLGNPSTIFEKMRSIMRRLPVWMDAGFDDKFCLLANKRTKSLAVGEAGDMVGRGARSTIYFLDEYAFMPHQHSVDAAVSNNSECVIYASTFDRPDDLFSQKVDKIPTFRFSWRDDPRKDDAWYAEQLQKYDPSIIAREIDCVPDPIDSDRAFTAFDSDDHVKDIPFGSDDWSIGLGIDHGERTAHETAVFVAWCEKKNLIYVFDEYVSSKPTEVEEDASHIKAILAEYSLKPRHIDMAFGDINTMGKGKVGYKVNQALSDAMGCTISNARKDRVDDNVMVCNMAFRRDQIIINPRCKNLITSLKHWKHQPNKEDLKHMIDAFVYVVKQIIQKKFEDKSPDVVKIIR